MSDLLTKYDDMLKDNGPAALVMTRELVSVEGEEGWVFPPTFASTVSAEEDEDEGAGGRYQVDVLGNGRNVCLIDSIGSQANRMEPLFKNAPYDKLVPQIVVRMKDGHNVNLLDVGHRAADAAVRFSKKIGQRLREAFEAIRDRRDYSKLARVAPTSLIFGVWDSRGTQVNSPRIVRSVIRAYDVEQAKRSATYRAAYEYTDNEVIKPALDQGKGKKNPLSQEGFKFSLASDTHGGIISKRIRQEAIVNLVALRSLSDSIDLRRYLLGLALVAISYRNPESFNLREGCLLRARTKDDFSGKWRMEFVDGREPVQFAIAHDDALSYAEEQAIKFEVKSRDETDEFDKETAEAWLKLDKKTRKTQSKKYHPKKAIEAAKKSPKTNGQEEASQEAPK